LSPVSTAIVIVFGGSIIPVSIQPLSLAVPPWVGAMNTDVGFGYRWGRNDEFCVAVGSAIRTAGILA